MAPNKENLAALHMAYDALSRAGKDSLSAAYNFGQIVDALSSLFTYEVMAAELNRSAWMVSTYARLYRKYARVGLLLDTAEKLDCYDVGKLANGSAGYRYQLVLHCNNCGSDDIQRERERVASN